MREIGTVMISLLDDRGVKKFRMNIIGKNRVIGCLKPTFMVENKRSV